MSKFTEISIKKEPYGMKKTNLRENSELTQTQMTIHITLARFPSISFKFILKIFVDTVFLCLPAGF